MLKDYIFVYKDSRGKWCIATNPVFIAKHNYCRAIPHKEVEKLNFDTYSDFVYALNSRWHSEQLSDLVKEFDLY